MTIPSYILPITCFLFVTFDAFTDMVNIKEGEAINHKRGAIYYLIASLILGAVFLAWSNAPLLDIIVFPVITRMAFFDPLLNVMLGKSFIYEGVYKTKKDRSFTDWIEGKIGLSVIWLRVIYLALFIGYLIYSLI